MLAFSSTHVPAVQQGVPTMLRRQHVGLTTWQTPDVPCREVLLRVLAVDAQLTLR